MQAVMNNSAAAAAVTALELRAPDGSSQNIQVAETPFTIGRGGENHLGIAHDHLSRKCAVITQEDDRYFLEDRGNRGGVFINGVRISRQPLANGDVITFGAEVKHSLVFRSTSSNARSLENLVSRLEGAGDADAASGLERLNLLLEATRL